MKAPLPAPRQARRLPSKRQVNQMRPFCSLEELEQLGYTPDSPEDERLILSMFDGCEPYRLLLEEDGIVCNAYGLPIARAKNIKQLTKNSLQTERLVL